MKVKKSLFRYYFLILYLALGSVVWFASFSLGVIKSILLLLVIIGHHKMLSKGTSYVYFKYFFLFIALISVSFFFHSSETDDDAWGVLSLYYTYFLNYLFFIIGYNYCRSEAIEVNHLKKIIWVIIPLCFLTITNFLFKIPDWYAPNLLEHKDQMENLGYEYQLLGLFSSGFGLGRTGWATTLTQYLPLTLLFLKPKNKVIGIFSFIIILVSIFVSGSRGGLLISMIVAILILGKTSNKITVPTFLMIGFWIGLIVMDNSNFASFYRLDSGDITSGRSGQYSLVPQMLMKGGLFGLGIEGSYHFSRSHGFDYALHNVYLRFLIDYGWIIGLFVLVVTLNLSLKIVNVFFKLPYNNNNVLIFILTFILIGGMFAGMIEPAAIFEARSWWVIWWFSFGAFLCEYKRINL